MSDAYSSFASLLEEKAVIVVGADAWLKTGSGTRLECKTIEAGLRANPGDYNLIDVPAVALQAEMPDEDDPAAYSTERAVAVLIGTVVVSAADINTRRTLALDIGARLRRIFREQISGGAWSNLDQVVPGADAGSISTAVSGPVVDDLGQTENASVRRIAIATVVARVSIDVDATI